MRELVCDPGWTGVSPTATLPHHLTNPVWDAERYMTKRKGMRLAKHRSVVTVYQIDEPQGEGLLIQRGEQMMPEVVYFVVPRWRKPWGWFRLAALWLGDRAASGPIGALIGAALSSTRHGLSHRDGGIA